MSETNRLGAIGGIAAGVETEVGSIRTQNCRTLAITCRATYNALATSGVTVKLYFIHPDVGQDTVAFTSFVPTLTAGSTVQRTILVDAPETDSLAVKVKNDDSTYSAVNVIIGYSIVRWSDTLNENPRRLGNPKTDEERAMTHQAKYGTLELPSRGSGL